MKTKLILNYDQIADLYFNQGKTDQEIADIINRAQKTEYTGSQIKKWRQNNKLTKNQVLINKTEVLNQLENQVDPQDIAKSQNVTIESLYEWGRRNKISLPNRENNYTEEFISQVQELVTQELKDKEIGKILKVKPYVIRNVRLKHLNTRKKKLKAFDLNKLLELHSKGLTREEIAEEFGVKPGTVAKWCQKHKLLIEKDFQIDKISKELLEEEYVNKSLTCKEIAKKYTLKENRVFEAKEKHGIDRTYVWTKKQLPEKLNNEQYNLVYGTMLGDGSIYNEGNHFCYSTAHAEKQHGYTDTIFKLLKPFNSNIRLRTDGTKLVYCYNHPEFKKAYEIFYPDTTGNKRTLLTNQIVDLLTLEMLVYWYLDDGERDQRTNNNIMKIGTNFDFEDSTHFLQTLYSKFGLVAYIRENVSSSCVSFKHIIIYMDEELYNHLNRLAPACMQYKVPENPVYRHYEENKVIVGWTKTHAIEERICKTTGEKFNVPWQSQRLNKDQNE